MDVTLRLRESARSMLLQLKVQNALSEGGVDQHSLEQLIRAHYDEFAWCPEDELAAFAVQAWEEAQPSQLRVLHGPIAREPFVEWYAGFLALIDDIKAKPKMARACGERVASQFASDLMWTCNMAAMADALDAAWAKGRTPLLLDATADGGTSTPLETFFAYSGDKVIDMKRLVVEVDVKREKRLEDAVREMRAKLILCMRRGYHLVVMLSNAAPRMHTTFTSDAHLPYVLFEDNAEVQRVVGPHAEDWRKVAWARALLREDDSIFCVHKDFNVLVVSRFAPDTYEAYLGKELPLACMQVVRVTKT